MHFGAVHLRSDRLTGTVHLGEGVADGPEATRWRGLGDPRPQPDEPVQPGWETGDVALSIYRIPSILPEQDAGRANGNARIW